MAKNILRLAPVIIGAGVTFSLMDMFISEKKGKKKIRKVI